MSATPAASSYTVVGAGAIGGTLAYHLAAAGIPVTLVDTDRAHVEAVNANGLRITGGHDRPALPIPASTPEEFQGQLGSVLLAVKAQHTRTALEWIAPRLEPEGWVASMQNGLNEDAIAALVGAERTVAAFVNLNADITAPGVVTDGGKGALVVGEPDGRPSGRTRQLAADLRAWGEVEVSANVYGYLWAKLAYGAVLTATALADETMAESVGAHPRLMGTLAREVTAVAADLGVRVEGFDAFDAAAYLPDATFEASREATLALAGWLGTLGKTHSGIWRDLAVRKRKAEVGAHYAPVLQTARERGIPVPALARTLEMLAQVEEGARAFGSANLQALEAGLPTEREEALR